MEIPLPQKFEKMLREKVSSGSYASISEVIQTALLLLDEKEKLQQTVPENTQQQYVTKDVADHLAVTIWNGEKWEPHALDTIDINKDSNSLSITNTSHQHDHVKLILSEELPPNFKIEVVLEGQWRELGLLDSSGADRVIYFGASNTDKYTYTLEREKNDLILKRDGKKISRKTLIDIHAETDYHFFIGVNANNSIKIYTETPKTKNICDKPQQPIHYKFTVDVISGSHNGDIYTGTFSYDASLLKNTGSEKIEVLDLKFVYRGDTFCHFDCDSIPEVEFVDGEFKDLYLVGGPQTKRFGINAGFHRGQFGRGSEFFIHENKSYFGYLDEATYVDGAGKIEYCKVECSEKH